MKKIIFLLVLLSVAYISKAQQNADASKPTAAVSAIKAISDSFLPGVFDGIKGVLDKIKANNQSKDDLAAAKKQISDLSAKSAELRKKAISALHELKAYYVSESKDFITINEFYSKVINFSTQVNTLVAISDLMTNNNVGYSCNEAKIALIIQFKTACGGVVTNFVLNENNFISDNVLLNSQVLNQKRTIDQVIGRIRVNNLDSKNTFNMSSEEISNYFNLVADIKNNGTYKFVNLETSVKNIEDLLGSYLIDFSRKTNRITANVDSIMRAF